MGLGLSLAASGARPASAGGERVEVFRCVDAKGRLALQDRPCPPGAEQARRSIAVPPAPVPEARDGAPKEAPAADAPVATVAEPQPPAIDPPPLWECVDHEGRRRYAAQDDPRPRYVPYWVVAGSDLGRFARGGRIVREAGGDTRREVLIEDLCAPLPAPLACKAYRSQRNAARREAWNRIGDAQRRAEAEAERLGRLVQRHCGG